jgi:2C-methyl-D-erythritol 2,4-cyclodiphosphate synthase
LGSEVGPLTHDGEGAERAEAALRDAVLHIERHNYQIVSLDITVSVPELSANRMEGIRQGLAKFAHVGPANVVVKSAPGAGMPGAGGEEATAIAITLLDQIADLDMLHASIRSGG